MLPRIQADERKRLVRFGVVGVAVNLAAYLMFLALFRLGASPLAAMSAGYVTALALGFVANRVWTFAHRGSSRGSAWKYAVLYVAIYVAQALLLEAAVRLGFNIPLFQLAVLVVMAGASFLAQRLWVFPQKAAGASVSPR